MTQMTGLQSVPYQTFNHSLTGGVIYVKMYYRIAVQMWFIDINYNTKIIKNIRVCANINILDHWKKTLPFGLMVRMIDGGSNEPFLIDDFSTGRCILYILSSDDLTEIEDYYAVERNLI
jgi:hypothetical protein